MSRGDSSAVHCWKELCSDLGPNDSSWLMSLVGIQILHCASQFQRRVHQATVEYPFKILWLVKSVPNKQCKLRQQISTEILEAKDDQLHHVPRKMKHLYKADLLLASKTGILGFSLACALTQIKQTWKADVRECERINKQLSLTADRCPNASVELVSARAMIKHYLGAAVRGRDLTEAQRKKWSTLKPVATDLLHTCVGAWDDKTEVLSNPSRWNTPDPVPSPPAAQPLVFLFSDLCDFMFRMLLCDVAC